MYDPVGNITEIVDNSVNDIVTGYDLVDPGCAFTCDVTLPADREHRAGSRRRSVPGTYHSGFMGHRVSCRCRRARQAIGRS